MRGVPESVHRDDTEQENRQEQQAAAPCGDSVLFALHRYSCRIDDVHYLTPQGYVSG
jgi:hypothetical protein